MTSLSLVGYNTILLNKKHKIRYYVTNTGKMPFLSWLKNIKNGVVRHRVLERLDRVTLGNFGDHKSVGNGVYELRCQFENGIRIYYGIDKQNVVLLLNGGDKSSQEIDIKKATIYWQDYCGDNK